MKKFKTAICLLFLSCRAFAETAMPNFADTVKSKTLLIQELAMQTDFATAYRQQTNKFITIAAIELVIILALLAVLIFRKRATK